MADWLTVDVAAHCGSVDQAALEPYRDAAKAAVQLIRPDLGWAAAEAEIDPVPIPATVQLATAMLTARLWERRGTALGIAAFDDGAAVRVGRNDPDIARLLQTGPYTPPRIA